MERAVLVCEGPQILPAQLSLDDQDDALPLELMNLEDAERHLLASALRRYDRNVDKVAEALGLSRSACYRRIEKHGL